MRKADAAATMQTTRPTVPPARPKVETARLGKEIYERNIRPQVEADNYGDVVAIDVDSGHWTIGHEASEAVNLLSAQWPEAHDILCLRVGRIGVYSFGGSSLRRPE